MQRYLNIFLHYLKNNLIRELEFRENFIILLIVDTFWVAFQLFLIETFFGYTDSLLGWKKYELFFLVGFFRIVKGMMDVFIRPNLIRFPNIILTGGLDIYLTKPINSMFQVSVRYHQFSDIGSFVGGVAAIIYTLVRFHLALDPIQILMFLTLSLFSVTVFYCLFFLFTTMAIYMPRLTALKPYYDLISSTMRYPGEIFTRGSRVGELLLFPFLLIATYPVKIILSKISPTLIPLEVIATVILFIITYAFWNYSLKRYSSASS